jgi:FixJ family two-component response regulator
MNPKIFDFILIDDDKYIRLSWEYFAKNSNKKIRTFSNVESFLEVATDLDKRCSIYLDLNINGEKTTKYLDEISKLGFKNIILATGEKIEIDMLPKGISRITGKLPPL